MRFNDWMTAARAASAFLESHAHDFPRDTIWWDWNLWQRRPIEWSVLLPVDGVWECFGGAPAMPVEPQRNSHDATPFTAAILSSVR